MNSAANFFSKEQKLEITGAIKSAELDTSGEIRVHIENNCAEDVLDRAAFWFAELKMHKTEQRNGVLFYLSLNDHKFAILGDAGINAVVPQNFWDEVKNAMLPFFVEGNFTKGLTTGIGMAGEKLKQFFAYQTNDINELDDEISFGK
jgi:uncharacterized membrane protein